MALRSPQQFIESLRDGREVYVRGQRVADVTRHPYLRIGIETAAVDYRVAQDPQCGSFAVVEEDGEPISRFFQAPRTPDDLLKRRELIEHGSRLCCGFPPFAKEGGGDALNAVLVASRHADKGCETNYHARALEYRRYLYKNDLSVAIAMTDVKGDRALRPGQQPDPDHYLHIVEERPDGIVVRGAKAHLTTGPYTNEILVLPTRNMTAEERHYAVCFAVPANAPGLKMVCKEEPYENRNPFDYPVSARYDMIEALVIFDDVFVPRERVFLSGEHEYATHFVEMFANYHRVTAATYKYPYLELMVGAALLMAEANGTARVGHVRDKIAWLVLYAETVAALTRSACLNPTQDPDTGMVYPDPVTSNAVKYYFADNYHAAIKAVQDIAGGIVVTGPAEEDYRNPSIGPLVEKYLRGSSKVSGEARLRTIRLVKDLTASALSGFWEVTTLHAEGSLAAERLAVLASGDLERYRSQARRAAGLGVPDAGRT
ncbi:MAG: hypothetical protein HY535_00670 [Chloroflexi bacterium]|nr:hypothetical protein [Chloroflexota bacterium]